MHRIYLTEVVMLKHEKLLKATNDYTTVKNTKT